MVSKLAGLLILMAMSACASRPAAQAADPISVLQRKLNTATQCKRAEVSYCSAHGSRAKDGLCTCMKQQDAKSALDNIN